MDVIERPCLGGGHAVTIGEQLSGGSRKYRCPPNNPATGGKTISYANKVRNYDGNDDDDDDENEPVGSARPASESKPDNAPTDTVPINESGLTREQIHEIKESVGSRPKDWTGIAPNRDVITTDSSGHAKHHGPWDTHTNNK